MADFIKKFETDQGDKQVDFQALGNFPKAKVGQVLKVKAVDADGNPIEWEAGNAGDETQAYTYGQEDLTAGVSELATGKLHFVYE